MRSVRLLVSYPTVGGGRRRGRVVVDGAGDEAAVRALCDGGGRMVVAQLVDALGADGAGAELLAALPGCGTGWAELVRVEARGGAAHRGALTWDQLAGAMGRCCGQGWDPEQPLAAAALVVGGGGAGADRGRVVAALEADHGPAERNDGRTWSQVADLVAEAHRRVFGGGPRSDELWYLCCEVLAGDCAAPLRSEVVDRVAASLSVAVAPALMGSDGTAVSALEAVSAWPWAVITGAAALDPALAALCEDIDGASTDHALADAAFGQLCHVVRSVLCEVAALG